ncbi:MAG: methylated-DNA--[protein]-cysteine S-methyltransferase [Betaproteobacteria bacterium]
MKNPSYSAIVSAPTFSLGVICDQDWITEIRFLEPQPEVAPKTPLAAEAVRQLRGWLENPDFDFGLPLKPSGTTFQRRVWEQISSVPAGQTKTYGEVAKALHNAPRAVGQACGANPFPVVVPCHRIVASSKGLNDGLGGFARNGGGFLLDVKRWLLAHERRA